MKRKCIGFVAALVLLSGSHTLAQTVNELIDKHIQAMGGAENFKNLKSITISSTFKMMGMDMSQRTTIINNKAFRQEMSVQGMNTIQVVEGDKGWTVNTMAGQPEPTDSPAEMVKLTSDQLDLTGALFNPAEKGNVVELVGKESVGTTETYKLKVTKKNGSTEYHNLDIKTYLPVKVIQIQKIQGQDFKQEVTNSNFQPVGGLQFPFTMSIKSDAIPSGAPIDVTVTKIDVNPTVDEAIFKKPAKK